MTQPQIQAIEKILGNDANNSQIKLGGPNWKQQPGDSEDSPAADNLYYYYCQLATGRRIPPPSDKVKNVISRKVKAHKYIQCVYLY